jgi:hypothetical protein
MEMLSHWDGEHRLAPKCSDCAAHFDKSAGCRAEDRLRAPLHFIERSCDYLFCRCTAADRGREGGEVDLDLAAAREGGPLGVENFSSPMHYVRRLFTIAPRFATAAGSRW